MKSVGVPATTISVVMTAVVGGRGGGETGGVGGADIPAQSR